MLTLTLQFIIAALLPLTFLVLLGYLWRSPTGRRPLRWSWGVTLLVAIVWASSVLRHYGGITFDSIVRFNWEIIGKYGLTLLALGILWTTQHHLSLVQHRRWVLLLPGLVLLLAAILLDPTIWPQWLADAPVAGVAVRLFDLWAAVWIASWFVPTLGAFLLTRHAARQLAHSLYRNQVQYWLLMLGVFALGAALASIQQPNQPGWQQAGILLTAVSTSVGTLTLINTQLPALPLATRQFMGRLSNVVVVFLLSLLGLWLAAQLSRAMLEPQPGVSPLLLLLLGTVLFTAVLTIAIRLANRMARRVFLPKITRYENLLAGQRNIVGGLPEPEQIARIFLHLVQANLLTNEAWFFMTEAGVGGRLGLRPIATLEENVGLTTAVLPPDSPFVQHLRQEKRPLAQYDVAAMSQFDTMSWEERQLLTQWGRSLYVPLHLGDSLVALALLGDKQTGDVYTAKDFDYLAALAEQTSPLLVQAQNVRTMQRLNDHVQSQNQSLIYEKQRLQAFVMLYQQFVALVSPALRQPFDKIGLETQRLQEKMHQLTDSPSLVALNEEVDLLRTAVDKLIVASARLQNQAPFHFATIQLDHIIKRAIRQLDSMAEARRVNIEYVTPPMPIPNVYGDEQQLQQALHYLIHNAIKFNRINGTVQIELGADDEEVTIEIQDEGVGIPEERLDKLWQGLDSSELFPNGNYRSRRPRLGLGLTLAYTIITAHGGHISARSSYGSSSTFTIHLPFLFEG
ncbi:MAG: ATP-binding protein [Chloroflexota bacterium]